VTRARTGSARCAPLRLAPTRMALLISSLVFGLSHAGAEGATLQGPDRLAGGSVGVEASVVALRVCGTVGLLTPLPWKRGVARPGPGA
jgi:hypothetical protein